MVAHTKMRPAKLFLNINTQRKTFTSFHSLVKRNERLLNLSTRLFIFGEQRRLRLSDECAICSSGGSSGHSLLFLICLGLGILRPPNKTSRKWCQFVKLKETSRSPSRTTWNTNKTISWERGRVTVCHKHWMLGRTKNGALSKAAATVFHSHVRLS